MTEQVYTFSFGDKDCSNFRLNRVITVKISVCIFYINILFAQKCIVRNKKLQSLNKQIYIYTENEDCLKSVIYQESGETKGR